MLDKDDLDLDLEDEDEAGDETGDENEVGSTYAALSALAPQPDPHASTPLDLARMGLADIAYIRRAVVNEVPMWTIHSAAGDPLGAAESFDLAWAAVKQNHLEPVRVH